MKARGQDASSELSGLWPMVSAAANATVRALTPDGLPVAAMDYWEHGERLRLAPPRRCSPDCGPRLPWRPSSASHRPCVPGAGR